MSCKVMSVLKGPNGKYPNWKAHSGENMTNGNCVVFAIDNKTVKLYDNTKINGEYNK